MIKFVKENFRYLVVGFLFACVVFVWYAVFCESRSGLAVYFLDVGQGDSIFIQAENGNQILIDGGQNKSVLNQLSKVMPFYDRVIDVVIETHPDGDHIGGLVEVLNRYDVGLVMESGVKSDSAIYKELKNIIGRKNITEILGKKGMRMNVGEGLFLDILFPVSDASEMESNSASIVARLVYENTSFLLTGDSPQAIEKYLASVYKDNLDVDVLKVGHHGSKTSSSEIFIGYTSPEYAIVSVGADNRYGHPSQEVLDILKKLEVKVLRTDEMGTIKIKSDGENLSI
ncbi:MBL fold metallo-hydrolase [Patescibacteria group bacterium]|nr:MBL fold metallo-hydrolase [Patescibacteria group bacterium]